MIARAALVAGGASFLLALAGAALARRAARRLRVVDLPRGRKAHRAPIPLLGGSAIYLAVAIPAAAGALAAMRWAGDPPGWLGELAPWVAPAAEEAPRVLWILLLALGLHAVGVVDDLRALGAWAKLVPQLAIATVTVLWLDVRVLTVAGEPVSSLVSILWLVVLINAFNFLDNMDGLAAGVAAICAAALLAAAGLLGQFGVVAWMALLLGALLGFLPYNLPPARMFMGDGGSLVIGYLLATVTTLTTYARPGGDYAYGVLVPLVLMAVPLYDTGSVVLLRLRAGHNPMVGDQRHFSHRLVRRGMTPRAAVGTICLCTAGTAMGAVLLAQVQGPLAAGLVFAQTLAILGIIALLESGRGSGDER